MARDYWKDRQAKALVNLSNKSAKEIDEQLKKYYKRTMDATIKDFEATYDKLLATMEEGREPTPADLYKLDKYWQMQAQLKDQLQALGDTQAAILSKQFEANYINVYNSLAKDSGKAFSRISTETARQMINNVWAADGKSWSARIWENTADLADTLNEKLIECVVGGKKTSDLKKALMERFGVSFNRADALARTELAQIQTQAAKKRYEDTGIEYVQIWADKDERQCEYCGKLHKKIYPVGASVPIPAHPRCRCCIIPVVDVPEDIAEQTQQAQQTTQSNNFVAANTVDEAQAYADKFVQTYKTQYNGNVSYKGLDTEHANAVNKAITMIYDDYDIEPLRNIKTMNFRENRFKTAVDDGTAAAYQWGGGGDLFVNQKLLGNKKLEKAFTDRANELLKTVIDGASTILSRPNLKEAQRNYINALLKTGRQCVAQTAANFTETTIIHEMGHALHDKIFWKYGKTTKNPNGIDFAESMSKYGGNISGYAISNYREYIAESFAAYYCGESDKLDPEIVKMFEGAKKKK